MVEQTKSELQALNSRYGSDNTKKYFTLLGDETRKIEEHTITYARGIHDGDKCTRNEDGTTYWDKCSTWNHIVAYVESVVQCSSLTTGGGNPTPTEEYYDCVQSEICENC